MKLSNLQKRVYNFLKQEGGDVLIKDLHEAAYTFSHDDDLSVRRMQQRLGSVIARINEKVKGEVVAPGSVKQTYRLTKKEK